MKTETIKSIVRAERAMIIQLIDLELEKSKIEHEETFNSAHEAESVIREELEEAVEEVEECKRSFERLHNSLRNDDEEFFKDYVEELKRDAAKACMELIQLCAMCKKWRVKNE